MPATGIVSALNQSVYNLLTGNSALVALIGVDSTLLSPTTNLPLPAIYNDWKSNTPPIYPQVCFRFTEAVRLNYLRESRVSKYFLQIDMWTLSQRQDATDQMREQIALSLDRTGPGTITAQNYDPLSWCFDCHETLHIPVQWRPNVRAYISSSRYEVTAGRSR